jgi:hypothetical protein
MLTDDGPVPPEDILDVLKALSSQDPSHLKAAEERLKQFGGQTGTWDTIHRFAADPSLPLDVRKQALIQFKNGALQRWRSRKSVFIFTFDSC